MNGTWVARNADATALYPFASEIAALRFVNSEGYYMEVLLVPHGEDALRYAPTRSTTTHDAAAESTWGGNRFACPDCGGPSWCSHNEVVSQSNVPKATADD